MLKIFNNKGSTLLMILIMASVLTVLGTVALSMSFMNLNMKYNDARSKKAMYYSESGIDQVYAYMNHKVEENLGEAKEDTDYYIAALKNYLETTLLDDYDVSGNYIGEGSIQDGVVPPGTTLTIAVDLSTTLTFLPTTDTDFIEFYIEDVANGILPTDKKLNVAALEEVANKHYERKFKDLFDANNAAIVLEIQGLTGLTDGTPCVITVAGGVSNFADEDILREVEPVGSFSLFDVTSVFNYNGNVEKNISVNLIVKVPDNLYPLEKSENTISVEDNPVWQNALVSNSDIIFNSGTTTTIVGDVYALGKGPEFKSSGVDVKGNVSVLGDIVSLAYVQTSANGASLTTNNGLVYCNSLVTASGADGSSISINDSNVYTKDDIELNALNSQLAIDGSYYGMSDGSEALAAHNSSSSIIINVPLYDGIQGAKLSINGSAPVLDLHDSVMDLNNSKYDEASVNHGVWIPGTAYIDVTGVGAYWPYQTGESVSIKGNYKAYITDIPTEILNPTRYDDTHTVRATAMIGSVPIELPVETTYLTVEKPDAEYTVYDKINYFVSAYNYMNPIDPTYFNFNLSSVDIQEYKYTLGTTLPNPSFVISDANLSTFKGGLKQQIMTDYLSYLKTTTNSEIYDVDSDALLTNFTSNWNSFNILNQKTNIAAITSTTKVTSIVNSVNNALQEATEVIYISPIGDVIIDANQVEDLNPNHIYAKSVGAFGYMQGVIITQGNVTINGNIDFTGVIIAGGNITVNGSNCSFHNSEKASLRYLVNLIRDHSDLRNLFNKDTTQLIQYYTDDIISSPTGSNNVNNYKEFVKIDNWRLD